MGKKSILSPTFEYELDLFNAGHSFVAGVDEVGRGALAGPIVAAAAVFEANDDVRTKLAGVNDSKVLMAHKREELDTTIKDLALDYAIGEVSALEIDQMGIGKANILAFKRALDKLKKCDFALIDGRKFRGFPYPYRCLEKGESKSLSIAAASIIAKVYRDSLMADLHKEFELYNFASNKGYGSQAHLEAISAHGVCSQHRQSFLGEIVSREQKLF